MQNEQSAREAFKQWWQSASSIEQRALITLGVILSGVLVFCAGVQAGKIAAMLLSAN
ncbi:MULTISPECIES: type II secretion system protein M [Microbulbifer]|uniref:type II secretion system protein M n=1 Tax=Microbulbifer TaxID=48073 RepID=UPI001E5CFB41|nr:MULTISPECIES: type II secretion system protein M [Microbulbifer]UHQ54241.1 type II secretion system protein M [Microbulbifer sp. YPW16]